jgi:hypothetical protein
LARSKANSRKNIASAFIAIDFVPFDLHRILRQLKIIKLYINRLIISIILSVQPNPPTTSYIAIRHGTIITELLINKFEKTNQ